MGSNLTFVQGKPAHVSYIHTMTEILPYLIPIGGETELEQRFYNTFGQIQQS